MKRVLPLLLFLSSVLILNVSSVRANPDGTGTLVEAKWEFALSGGAPCIGSDDCHVSSPVLVDINNDGFTDVVAATFGGYLTVVNH